MSSASIRANTGNVNTDQHFIDIHAVPPPPSHLRSEFSSVSTTNIYSTTEATPSENYYTMSREFSQFSSMVLAGSTITNHSSINSDDVTITGNNNNDQDDREVFGHEEINPLAIVPDNYGQGGGAVSVQRVKKEEVEAKISAWQTAKVAKINNRFKRQEAIINGWEKEQVQKASSWMQKVERKLEEKRARALEKTQNEVAKAQMKAEEGRASAEAKRGIKVAKVYELANLMRALGRAPVKRFF